MATVLGQVYSPSWGGIPPRMSKEDYEIFQRWWPSVRGGYSTVYFDVGLGRVDLSGVGGGAEYVDMWVRNNQLRADVVAVRADSVDLIELRFNAQASGVGRLLAYRDAYVDDPVLGSELRLVLVTNNRNAVVERLAGSLGILYVVV